MKKYIILFILSTLLSPPIWAQTATPTINTGDTAWMVVATVLVLFMSIPGLSLFYGGAGSQKKRIEYIHAGIHIGCCNQYRMGGSRV